MPSEGIGETALLGEDLLLQFGHLPPQRIQLGHLGLDIQLLVIATGLGLVDGVNAGHGDGTLDVRDPDWGDLLEAKGEADVVDMLAVDRGDVQAKELLLRHMVAVKAGEVPGGVDDSVLVEGEGAVASLAQGLAIDGDVAVATRVGRLVNVESEDEVLAEGSLV